LFQTRFSEDNPWFIRKHFDGVAIFEGCPLITVDKGSVLIAQGTPVSEVYYIEEGRARISVLSNDGDEKTICILDKGNVIGDMVAINNKPSPINVIANTNLSLRRLHIDKFLKAILSDINHAKLWITDLCFDIEYLINHIKDISFRDSFNLVANYLYRLSENYGIDSIHGIKINMIFTHQEMADLIGCSRVTVSKIMTYLKDTNIIDRINGFIYIKDKAKLLELIQTGNSYSNIKGVTISPKIKNKI
jgi:CRP/FNR family cyclic AMP-dependent transcriptional regulator